MCQADLEPPAGQHLSDPGLGALRLDRAPAGRWGVGQLVGCGAWSTDPLGRCGTPRARQGWRGRGGRVIFVGVDWAEAHHEVCVLDQAGAVLGCRSPDGVAGVAQRHGLVADHASEPSQVVVGIELDRGLLVGAPTAAGYQVVAVNPLAASRYRERHAVSGAKSDPGDAKVLADLVRTDRPESSAGRRRHRGGRGHPGAGPGPSVGHLEPPTPAQQPTVGLAGLLPGSPAPGRSGPTSRGPGPSLCGRTSRRKTFRPRLHAPAGRWLDSTGSHPASPCVSAPNWLRRRSPPTTTSPQPGSSGW